MKSLWTPWTVLIIVLLGLGVLVLNGVINFDAPDISLTNNDIRPPNVRSFRINSVRVGDVIAVIDSVVLTPAQLEDPNSMVTGNTITFEADISDENRIVEATLVLYRLLPLPEEPKPHETFNLLEADYRLEWDASGAPNGLYGVSITVIDENQNEATVYPNVQLALLRFSSQPNATPAAPPTTQNTAPNTPINTAPNTQPTNPSTQVAPTPRTTPRTTPTRNTTPATEAFQRQADSTLRRDVVFAIFTTIFVLLLAIAGRLFVSQWSTEEIT